MPEAPVYLVVGRGRWAAVIRNILLGEHRQVATFDEARIGAGESAEQYQARLEEAMARSGASVAWLCLPFGPWVPTIAAAAMRSGLDVIAECPWLCAPEVTGSLMTLQAKEHRILSVHYEYCMLDEISSWRKKFDNGAGHSFHGIFQLSRPGRQGADAELQLGSHLVSIWQFAAPQASLGELRCSFDSVDTRAVWLAKAGTPVASVDFLLNKQPLIQRFIHSFEAGRNEGKAIFGLEFAQQVAARVRGLP